MMGQTLLITGATGLVGKALVKQCLADGHTVHYLSTRKSKILQQSNYKGVYWNPRDQTIDLACFEGVEVVFNLAEFPMDILASKVPTNNLLLLGAGLV